MSNSKHHIFISYSRKDFDEVSKLKASLESELPGINIWFDIDGIESGDEFADKIIDAIDNSEIVLFAVSDSAIESPWTKKEVTYAANCNKRIIPLLLKDAQLKGWYLFNYGTVDCIDVTNNIQYRKLVANLSKWCNLSCEELSLSVKEEKTVKHYDINEDIHKKQYSFWQDFIKLMQLRGRTEVRLKPKDDHGYKIPLRSGAYLKNTVSYKMYNNVYHGIYINLKDKDKNATKAALEKISEENELKILWEFRGNFCAGIIESAFDPDYQREEALKWLADLSERTYDVFVRFKAE